MKSKRISGGLALPWHAIDDFRHSVATWAGRPALRVAGQAQTYAQLDARAQGIAAAVQASAAPDDPPVAAIFATREADTYAAVLASQMLGQTYVPMNPRFPAARNRLIMDKSRASVVLCTRGAEAAVRAILAVAGGAPRLIVCDDVKPAKLKAAPQRTDNPYVYTLFTSGSTGEPKGVSIRHSNLGAYLDAVWHVADYGPLDRMSQNFDLTFDLSAHDMFVCWRAGAELVVPSVEDLDYPANYVEASGITCWFSVPSLAQKIKMQNQVTSEKLGKLRLSLFCGEALRIDLAQDWVAATGQRVENWYGPTEATIACTRYVVPPAPDAVDGLFGLTPIGTALPGMTTLVLTEAGVVAGPGERGELLVAGPQVADGYLDDPEKTNRAFVTPPGLTQSGLTERHYRTGDNVLVGSDGQIQFIGRADNQIKIRGYRVELGEVENVLSRLADGRTAVVVALPLGSATPTSLVGAVENWKGDLVALKTRMAEHLPDYMIPTRIRMIKSFPKNASGKVDRGAIAEAGFKKAKRLSEEAAAAAAVAGEDVAAPAMPGKVAGNKRAGAGPKRAAAAARRAEAAGGAVAPVTKRGGGARKRAAAAGTVVEPGAKRGGGARKRARAAGTVVELGPKRAAAAARRAEAAAAGTEPAKRGGARKNKTAVDAGGKKARKKAAAAAEISIVSLVRAINPSIKRLEITRADNLMSAGLDSMGFVEFTMRVEQAYGVALDQTIVAEMSTMSMNQMRVFLRKAQEKKASPAAQPVASASVKTAPHPREMRTIDLLDKFGGFVDASADPLVLCLGSSGFMRGINTAMIEDTARKAGLAVRAANLGMGKLSALGITELCEYIRDEMTARGRRLAHAVIELEPMQMSILPPAGDGEVVQLYRQGAYENHSRNFTEADSQWDAATGGTMAAKDSAKGVGMEADWEKKRNVEVRDTFAGLVKFVDREIEVWLRGIAALREVSDRVLVAMHPINVDDIAQQRAATAPNHMTRLIERVTREAGGDFMSDGDFDLERTDFKNLNHVKSPFGRNKLSQQIAARLFGSR